MLDDSYAANEMPLFVPVVFLIAGLFMLRMLVPSLVKAWRSSRWPTVKGMLDAVELVRAKDDDGDLMWTIVVRYTYQVGGVAQEGHAVALPYFSSSDPTLHNRTLQRIGPAGRVIDIYYDPACPTESCLLPGLRKNHLMVVCFFVMWFGVCVLFMVH